MVEKSTSYTIIKKYNTIDYRHDIGDRLRRNVADINKLEILSELKSALDEAAKYNPCPACKYDTEQLSKFISIKIESIKTGRAVTKEDIKPLKEVDYLGIVEDMAIVISKLIRPFTRISKVPDVYRKVLEEDMEGNRKSLNYLINARKIADKIKEKDKQLNLVVEIIDSFVRALNFKLSIDEYSFYIFDRVIKFGYRTHLLSATGKVIVGLRELRDPQRYK
ncbi:MAG: hypothetical protein QXT43_01815 [Candidatus Micrarchaeaceae archaeon]